MITGRFQRMYAIPEDEYQHLKSLQQTRDPMEKKFIDLSNQYKQQDTIPSVTKRVQLQGETLHEIMNVKDELKNRLIAATPKLYQSRASSLFQFIGNKVRVNDKGELQSSDGSVIAGSNIGDLIQHAVRDRRRNIIPPGWEQFVKILRDNNVPQMILNYDTLEEMKPSLKSSLSASTPSKIPIRQIGPTMKKEILSLPEGRTKRIRKSPDYFAKKEKKTPPSAAATKGTKKRRKSPQKYFGKKERDAKYF